MASIIPGPPDTRAAFLKRKQALTARSNQVTSLDKARAAFAAAQVKTAAAVAEVRRLEKELDAIQDLEEKQRKGGADFQLTMQRRHQLQHQGHSAAEAVGRAQAEEAEQVEKVKLYEHALVEHGTENFVVPSAEKFPAQFAAASGVVSVITAGAVSLTGSLARIVGFGSLAKATLVVGLAGIFLGLLFHVPTLWIHYMDWKQAEENTFDGKRAPYEVKYGPGALRLQFRLLAMQVSLWLTVMAGVLALVLRG